MRKDNGHFFLYAAILLVICLFSQTAQAQQQSSIWQQNWIRLLDPDPAQVFPAFRRFVSHPPQTVRFFKKAIRPISLVSPKKARQLISQLDDPDFDVRIKSYRELAKFGFRAEVALRQALKKANNSTEFKVRTISLLKKLTPKRSPKERRFWRALEILESIGSEEAKRFVSELAKSTEGSWRTQEAQESLRRMQQKRPDEFSGKAKLLHILRGHTGNVYSVAFSPNGKMVASGSSDDTVRLWDVQTGKAIANMGRQLNVYAIGFSRDGKQVIAGGSSGGLWIWDVAKKKKIAPLPGHGSTIKTLAVSPDGRKLVTGSYDNTAKIWDLEKRKCLRTMRTGRSNIYAVAYGPNGKVVASGSSDDLVRIWDVATGALVCSLKGHTSNVYSLAFCNDGKSILSADSGGHVHLWEILTRQKRMSYRRSSSHEYLAIHPDGRTWALAGSSDVILKDIIDPQEVTRLTGHSSRVRCLDFSADGRFLATGGYDNTIRIWDLKQ